jgi:mannose-6-phosphate isomerase
VSVVANGFLKGNNLQELIEVYMGELVGEKVYEKYGEEFPVLTKLIDARERLSVQVHPDDKLAAERHGAYGKTEMWYVTGCEPGAALYVGWRRATSEREYLDALAGGTVQELLNRVEVHAGDAFFIPAGTVHAIGEGVQIAEIQETSDVTYRIYDWDRVDDKGHARELHTELALAAIDFAEPQNYNVTRAPVAGEAVLLKRCPWFTVNLVEVAGTMTRNHAALDSFVIYMTLEGDLMLGAERITKGDSILIPAETEEITLTGQGRLLEIYIEI